ncbi:MAG TPA: hypothetical protein VIL61_04465, partial [Nitrospiria bacterium]
LIDDLNELRESLIIESAQRKLRLKSGAAEATAALETSAASKEAVTPPPAISVSPAASGEATATLKRSPEMAAAMTSGPTVVTAAPKSNKPMAIGIGIGAVALVGVLAVYGLWPARQETQTPAPAAPPSSEAATSPSVSTEIQPAVPAAENGPTVSDRPAVPNPPQAPSKKEPPKKPSEKKKVVAVAKQEIETPRPTPPRPVPPPVETKPTPLKEASIVPPGVETQPLRPDQIEKERILAIVKRQEEAFESKNVELFLADLAKAGNEQRKEISNVFEQYARLDVSFEVQELNLAADSATLKMIQSTRLVFKGSRPDQKTKTKVLWELSKVENNWKIRDTKVLEKMQ